MVHLWLNLKGSCGSLNVARPCTLTALDLGRPSLYEHERRAAVLSRLGGWVGPAEASPVQGGWGVPRGGHGGILPWGRPQGSPDGAFPGLAPWGSTRTTTPSPSRRSRVETRAGEGEVRFRSGIVPLGSGQGSTWGPCADLGPGRASGAFGVPARTWGVDLTLTLSRTPGVKGGRGRRGPLSGLAVAQGLTLTGRGGVGSRGVEALGSGLRACPQGVLTGPFRVLRLGG